MAYRLKTVSYGKNFALPTLQYHPPEIQIFDNDHLYFLLTVGHIFETETPSYKNYTFLHSKYPTPNLMWDILICI